MKKTTITHFLFKQSLLLVGLLLCFKLAFAQIESPYAPIISELKSFESAKDPKCHATAARLEDFLYGTPLSIGARNKRIEFQQDFVYYLWEAYTARLKNNASNGANSWVLKTSHQPAINCPLFL